MATGEWFVTEDDRWRHAGEVLANVGALITQSLAPREVQQLIVDQVRPLFAAKRAALYGVDPESGDTMALTVSGETMPAFAPESRLSRGMGLIAVAERERQPVATSDVLADRRVVFPGEAQEQLASSDLRAVLLIPLLSKDVMIGALVVADATGRVFTPEEIRIAQRFGHQAAVALENARLFEAQQHRADRLRALGRLNQLISSSLDAAEVLGRIAQAAADLMGVPVVEFWVADEPAQRMEFRAISNPEIGRDKPLTTMPFGQGGVGWVARHRRRLHIPDLSADPRIHASAWFRRHGLTSAMWVPIVLQDQFLGVLTVIGRRPLRLSPDDQELLESFVAQAAVAIRNATLFAESEARRQAAESLADVGRLLAETLDVDVVAQRIADSVRALLGANSSVVFRLDPASEDLVAVALSGDAGLGYTRGFVSDRGTGAAGLAVREGQPVTSVDVLTDPRITLPTERRRLLEVLSDRAVVAVPLTAQHRVTGAVTIRDRTGRVFREAEIRLAQAFADQAAIALENARLYADGARRRQEAERLADIARTLTESLDVTTVSERIVESVVPLFGAFSSGLYLQQPDGVLKAVAWGRGAREHFEVGFLVPPGIGVAGRTLATAAPAWCRDLQAEPGLHLPPDFRRRIEAAGLRAILAVPLRAKGAVIGVLVVVYRTARDFGTEEIALLQTFADQAATAIENARLYREAHDAYEELSRAQDHLVRGETLRALGELAAGAAHHLNNLLAVVLARVQLVLRKVQTPELRRPLELAERAALDSAEVVRRIWSFGQLRKTPAQDALELNTLVTEALEFSRPRWHDEALLRSIAIETRVDAGEIPPVGGDAAGIREVLVNLILNAVDAMPNGGALLIRTWVREGVVSCAVRDTGIGMSPEVVKRALEPFFTTKGVKSTGLGLSVNYGIIRRHGGELTIDSVEGQGTTVTFSLPALAASAAASPAPDRGHPRSLRILLVDDEIEVRHAMADTLSELGHTVTAVASGAEALAALATAPRADLVLTDLGMPGMTGWDVARAVKATDPSVRVGLVTGWGIDVQARSEDRLLVEFVLAKPVTDETLQAALARLEG